MLSLPWELKDTPDSAELRTQTTCMKMRGSGVSSSFIIFYFSPIRLRIQKKKKKNVLGFLF